MAEKHYISAHLDSVMHVFSAGPLEGTTARLYVTPWDKSTVADGYWQTVNTIQPLINRDIYLADALERLASKYTVYKEGYGINITPNADSTYNISVNSGILDDIPKYSFDNNHFNQESLTDGTTEISMKFKDETITADSNGIYCNVEKLINETKQIDSYSAWSGYACSSMSYEYTTANMPFTPVTALPTNLNVGEPHHLYIVG